MSGGDDMGECDKGGTLHRELSESLLEKGNEIKNASKKLGGAERPGVCTGIGVLTARRV